jgi:VanW like protein
MLPPEFALVAAFMVSVLLAGALFSGRGVKLPVVSASTTNKKSQAKQPFVKNKANKTSDNPTTTLGSAFLDLNRLVTDEADNARWSLVRDSSAAAGLYSADNGVDWPALSGVSHSGSFQLPAGSTWSFNRTFQGGVGYKMASGVLAGGHCALATVFRGAAIQAGLPTEAKSHLWPIPGFQLSETVNIWWGQDDLLVHNATSQDLSLAWELTPQGVGVSVVR